MAPKGVVEVELVLRPGEAQLLREVLSGYLSDLRMEISNTDRQDWREQMKEREAAIKEIIARLEQLSTTHP